MSFPVGPSPVAPSLPLPQELVELLQEFAVAVHKRGIYPPGHPMQLGAVDAVLRRLHGVLGARTELAIGVARAQLLVEGGRPIPTTPCSTSWRRACTIINWAAFTCFPACRASNSTP